MLWILLVYARLTTLFHLLFLQDLGRGVTVILFGQMVRMIISIPPYLNSLLICFLAAALPHFGIQWHAEQDSNLASYSLPAHVILHQQFNFLYDILFDTS